MRFLAVLSVLVSLGCAASPAPEANGYDVELYFEGAPVGVPLPVDQPDLVTVKRIEQAPSNCTSDDGSCDPTSLTPITLIKATCDALCTITPMPADGVVSLQAKSNAPGSTTLRVRVRSDVDGSEWDDAYPLTFQ
jgi:hypothetical protein